MTEPRPLVCVFLKLPPSHLPVSRIYEIARDEFLPLVKRLNHAFEAAQAVHHSSEAKRIWLEARKSAAKNLESLQNVSFDQYAVAFTFLFFLGSLHKGTHISEAYNEFQGISRQAVRSASIAQEVMVQLRENLRIAIAQITTILSGNDKDTSLFNTESNQSILEIATAFEECGARLEEFRNEVTAVQRQSAIDKDNLPSDEEFQLVQGKWQTFKETADRLKHGWEDVMDQVRGHMEGFEPPMTPPNNPTNSTMPQDPQKSDGVPFWRKFLRCISCFTGETIS